jgi:hypothetical protein
LFGVNAKAVFVDVELKVSDGLFFGIQAPPIVATASYGCSCSCCNCSAIVEKEEKVAETQEYKKPASKRNPRNSKLGKIYHFQH